MDDAPEPLIMLHPHSRWCRVIIDDSALADTARASNPAKPPNRSASTFPATMCGWIG